MDTKHKKTPQKKRFSNIVVIISFVIVLLYTVTVLALEANAVAVSDILTEWVFKFFGMEMIALSGITISRKIGTAFGRYEDDIENNGGAEG